MMTREVVIVSNARTAIGDFAGALESQSPIDLGITVLKGAIEKPVSNQNLSKKL